MHALVYVHSNNRNACYMCVYTQFLGLTHFLCISLYKTALTTATYLYIVQLARMYHNLDLLRAGWLKL